MKKLGRTMGNFFFQPSLLTVVLSAFIFFKLLTKSLPNLDTTVFWGMILGIYIQRLWLTVIEKRESKLLQER